MATNYPKMQNGHKICMQNVPKIDQIPIKNTYILQARFTKIYPYWDFWFENMPSGNPDWD
jgi:hypothetical protein